MLHLPLMIIKSVSVDSCDACNGFSRRIDLDVGDIEETDGVDQSVAVFIFELMFMVVNASFACRILSLDLSFLTAVFLLVARCLLGLFALLFLVFCELIGEIFGQRFIDWRRLVDELILRKVTRKYLMRIV